MEQIIIGVYDLGYENVQLVLREGHGGEFYTNPEKTLPRIKIGGDYPDWQDIQTVLLHEALEFALTRGGHRFADSQDLSNDLAAFVFHFSHSEFSDCCAKAAEFMTLSYTDLKTAWLKWGLKRKLKKSNTVPVPEVKHESDSTFRNLYDPATI